MATRSSKSDKQPVDDSKIVISVDDTQSTTVSGLVNQIEIAKQVPLVREVGNASQSSAISWLPAILLTVAGAIGGIVIWAVWGALPEFDDVQTANITASVTLALIISIALVLADALQAQSAAKLGRAFLIALPVALAASFIFGFVASSIYSTGVEQLFTDLQNDGFDPVYNADAFFSEFAARNHLNRGFAWMFMGVATGVAVGASTLSGKRIAVTTAGGAVGAFLGGFVFDFFQGEDQAQIAGLAITGAIVGLSMGILEQAVKSSWLQITQGGMAGKQFILYKNEITLGSSPTADVTLIKDPAIPSIAGVISRRGGVSYIASGDPQRPLIMDGAAVTQRQVLAAGASISVGGTTVVYNERNKKDVKSEIVRRT